MKYVVVITDQAERDVDEIARFIGAHEREEAARWFRGLLDALASLEEMPRRCRRAEDCRRFKTEIRQLNHSGYRVLFTIDRDQVRVLHVRHASRRPVRRGDLDDTE